ncbi:MAG: UvrD-helicase domain-containing protein [Bacteroidales bacterium OttesenSCG-928-I14]|nr:UvrD-helicase domain-containing protein [Bacteroidales bacterium OttesenSCG-928-I14]
MTDFIQQLNEKQRKAVLYNEGPSLVIAGAGSGKTKVITFKVAFLLKNGVSPSNILALTFTNKAAREMKVRIAEIVGEDITQNLWIGTFHSIFSKILRKEAEKIGFCSDFVIYDAQDSKNLIKTIIKDKILDNNLYKPSFVQSIISKAKNNLITSKKYLNNIFPQERVAQMKDIYISDIYLTYSNRCKISNAMDFDDLLLYTYLLFSKKNGVVQKYWDQFQFILIDEYQDINYAQHEIIKKLAEKYRRICVVGDDAQSIYSFRGANLSNILNFREVYPDSKLFKLEQNYRSTQIIVNAANSLISKNKEQIPKVVFSKKIIGEKIKLFSAYFDYEEGNIVTNRIVEMCLFGKYEYRDFAILYRTNAQSRIFEEALRKVNIPYRIYGSISFYQRKEIKDIIAYMRLISNPTDEEAIKRVINCPNRRIGNITVNKIITAANSHNTNLWEIISNPFFFNLKINSTTAFKLKKFCLLIKRFIEKASVQSAYDVGKMVIEETGLINEFDKDKTPENVSRIQNIKELKNSLHTFSQIKSGNKMISGVKISDFLAEISLLTDQDIDEKENDNFIKIMTIHASKGLEFKNVFVVGLEENLFPSELSKKTPQEIEEERRLLYVAITRARENVILTYVKTRFQNGQFYCMSPSRFIKDIDEQYLSSPLNFSCNSRFKIFKNKKYTIYRNIENLRVGSVVKHERFGNGKVVSIIGENDDAKATIKFENIGNKLILLKFSRIEIISDF